VAAYETRRHLLLAAGGDPALAARRDQVPGMLRGQG
jgi:hypothetical protein